MFSKFSRSGNNKTGFTLVEMAIVLTIVSGILMFAVRFLSENMAKNMVADTESKIAKIETAIGEFLSANGHLPCPAQRNVSYASANYGISTDCTPSGSSTGTVEVCTTDTSSLFSKISFNSVADDQRELYISKYVSNVAVTSV